MKHLIYSILWGTVALVSFFLIGHWPVPLKNALLFILSLSAGVACVVNWSIHFENHDK